MKRQLWQKILLVHLALFGCIACQANESSDALPSVASLEVEISCDQSTNVVTFECMSDDITPRWGFHDGDSSTETKVEKFYSAAGTYSVEVWAINKNGLSADSKTYSFTLDNNYGEQYQLVWSDEFDGTSLNTDIWHLEQGYIANNELQDYQTSGNHEVSDGTLKIIARKVNDNKEFGSYTSARMISYYGVSFTYGRIEARIKVPSGVGTWPAFWMLGNSILEGGSWPSCGEIDIMEHVGYDPDKIHATIHYWDNSSSYTSQNSSISVESEEVWLTYGVVWSDSSMKFYIDDVDNVYATYTTPSNKTNWPFDAPHFILLNLAIGGDWGGVEGVDNSIFDATGSVQMEVDYVRVYDKAY